MFLFIARRNIIIKGQKGLTEIPSDPPFLKQINQMAANILGTLIYVTADRPQQTTNNAGINFFKNISFDLLN